MIFLVHLIVISTLVGTSAVLCTIRYHLYNLKNVKNTHGGVLILLKFPASAFKLYKWYQIAQRITNFFSNLFWRFANYFAKLKCAKI